MAKKKTRKTSASEVRAALKQLAKEHNRTPSELVALLKPGSNSGKGSDYEREFCTRLSLWWTDDDRDDVFWRSQTSGGRATSRSKRGKTTAGQYGDVAATDAVGLPLMDVLTIELKRGYSQHTSHDMLDRLDNAAVQPWEAFFAQAINSHEQAGSFAWFMVTRRDRRQAWVWFPFYLKKWLESVGCDLRPTQWARMRVSVRSTPDTSHHIVGCSLDEFFEQVTPRHIQELHKSV